MRRTSKSAVGKCRASGLLSQREVATTAVRGITRDHPDFSVDEQSALAPTSPYARTKLVVEMILDDVVRAGAIEVVSLRYFNPIGADPQLHRAADSPPSHVLGKLITANGWASRSRSPGSTGRP